LYFFKVQGLKTWATFDICVFRA